jgi:hypothetical protein
VGQVVALYCGASPRALLGAYRRSTVVQESALKSLASFRALLWAKSKRSTFGKNQRCTVDLDSTLHCGARVRSILWASVGSILLAKCKRCNVGQVSRLYPSEVASLYCVQFSTPFWGKHTRSNVQQVPALYSEASASVLLWGKSPRTSVVLVFAL